MGIGGTTSSAGGTADVTINEGGLLQVAGAFKLWNSGTLTLDGGTVNANPGLDSSADTLDFRDGTLTVTGGVFLPNAGGLTDDYEINGSTSTDMPHLVMGNGATANIGRDLHIGMSKNGALTISEGGAVFNTRGWIGRSFSASSTGTVTVDGMGSTWTNSGTLIVGVYIGGILNITGGGAVFNTNCTIGNH